MTEHTVRVEFAEHLPDDRVAGMVTGLATYGNVDAQKGSKAFVVRIFRKSKMPGLEKQLAAWEQYGFLRWQRGA